MKTLYPGTSGPSVQLLQLALDRAGFGPLETDGIFGPATRFALTEFQRKKGLSPDGIAGNKTHGALMPYYTGYLTHRIRRGDTYFALADEYSTSMEAIELANPGYSSRNLPIGALVTVPLSFPVVPTDVEWFSALTGLCVRGLAARYPFIGTGSAGYSIMGRELWKITLGSGENRVLCSGAHHANEWITAPVLMKYVEDLCRAYTSESQLGGVEAGDILERSALCIVPCVDPDGVDLVTGELISGDYYNRAAAIARDYPRFPFPSDWKANIRGVDLNLQYPAGWESAKANKYAAGISSPAPADFVGYMPLSEPESRAMYSLALDFSPRLMLAYHTQGEVIYWRYGDKMPTDSLAIGRRLAELSGYALDDAPQYSAYAGYKDWFIDRFDRPGYTVEAGIGVNPLPISQFDEIYRRNVPLLSYAAIATAR